MRGIARCGHSCESSAPPACIPAQQSFASLGWACTCSLPPTCSTAASAPPWPDFGAIACATPAQALSGITNANRRIKSRRTGAIVTEPPGDTEVTKEFLGRSDDASMIAYTGFRRGETLIHPLVKAAALARRPIARCTLQGSLRKRKTAASAATAIEPRWIRLARAQGSRFDAETAHHAHVLVFKVMAVIQEQPRVRVEPHQHAHTLVRQHQHGVLPAVVDQALAQPPPVAGG